MVVSSFEYKTINGDKRTASSENSIKRSFPGGWQNPDWIVSGISNNDWLDYLGSDGGSWQTKIHIDEDIVTGPDYWFESQHPNQNSQRSDSIEIVDHSDVVKVVRLSISADPYVTDKKIISFDIYNKT